MQKSRYTEEQIVGILKESEAGVATAELCRKHGISEQTFYRWKAKYGGLEVSEAQRLRHLEEENRKLKQLIAEQALDIFGFKASYQKSGKPTGQARCGEDISRRGGVFRTACVWAAGGVVGDVSLSTARGALFRGQPTAARAAAWSAEERRRWGYRHANMESKKRFPHSHSQDGCCGPNLQLNSNPSALTYPD